MIFSFIFKVDFVNCFLNLIKQKIDIDLPYLINHNKLFSHTIDELLLFDVQLKNYLKELKEIKQQLVYENENFISCMNILCQNEDFFSNWLNLERLSCTQRIDQMLQKQSSSINVSSDSLSSLNEEKTYNDIWKCNYSDVDKTKPPQCAETFMLMIKTISGIMKFFFSNFFLFLNNMKKIKR